MITSVGQDYESTESRNEYRIGIRITYRERGISTDIGKSKDNFNKNKKPRCFNCSTYRHIAKEYQDQRKKEILGSVTSITK